MRNMIYDTGSPTAKGWFSLYLNPATSSANIRNSQNSVRGASGSSPVLHAFQVPILGIVDATSANDVQVNLNFTGGTDAIPRYLNPDFMSFTRYITEITGGGPNAPATVVVATPQPPMDTTSVQWTVGQLVTFRFRCETQYTCVVKFDPPPTGSTAVSAYSMNGDFPLLANHTGLGITFQVESFSLASSVHKFFELYRTSSAIGD